jgi:large subunit ribosomal protein L53
MLKYLSKVRVEFNALDKRASSALEFLAQCNSRKARSSNPNCEVVVKRRTDAAPPVVAVTFTNGREDVMDGTAMAAQEIRKRILEQAELMETEKMFRDAGYDWPVIIPMEEVEASRREAEMNTKTSVKAKIVTDAKTS